MDETNHTAIFREPDRLPKSTMEVIDTIYEVLPAQAVVMDVNDRDLRPFVRTRQRQSA